MRRLFVVALLLMVGLFTQLAVAQNANSGALQGIVTDPTGAVIPDVSLDFRNVETGDQGLQRQTQTVYTESLPSNSASTRSPSRKLALRV